MSLRCLPSSFGSIGLTVWEEISFKEFQDGHHGGHLQYRNRTILVILNLYVAPIPPIKFQRNLTYGFGGDAVWRISIFRNDFSNSESLCHRDASGRFGSVGLKVWKKMSFEEIQDGHHGCFVSISILFFILFRFWPLFWMDFLLTFHVI